MRAVAINNADLPSQDIDRATSQILRPPLVMYSVSSWAIDKLPSLLASQS